jgi:hypothetical protein
MVEIDRVQYRVPHRQTLQFVHAANVVRGRPQFIFRHFIAAEKAAEEPARDRQFPLAARSADFGEYIFSTGGSYDTITVYCPNIVRGGAFCRLFREGLGGFITGAQGFCTEKVAFSFAVHELRSFTGPWTCCGVGKRDQSISVRRRRAA